MARYFFEQALKKMWLSPALKTFKFLSSMLLKAFAAMETFVGYKLNLIDHKKIKTKIG
jgi:hypothetical protein